MEKTKARPRLFERAEAERMLPLVRLIVQDIVGHYRAFKDRVELYRAGTEAKQAGAPAPPGFDRESLEAEIESLRDKIHETVSELGELGVEFKDFDTGLVDFPSKRGEDVVYLCWRLGEKRIGFWHTLEGGFRGRQPIEAGEPETA